MADRPIRVYVAGPMTGYPDHNYPAFRAAKEQLEALGYEVKTPCDINEEIEHTDIDPSGNISAEHYAKCMAADLRCVIDWADEVVALTGWGLSKGAKLEIHTAQVLNKSCWGEWRIDEPHLRKGSVAEVYTMTSNP